MLPDLRFVLGALMVVAVTGMIGVGLFVSAKLFHQAKTGPLDSRHAPAFAGGAEWNQFYDAGSVRRYVGLARQGETREIADLPPEHQLQEAAPAVPLIALAPAELPEQESGTEAMPLAVRTPVAESGMVAVAAPVERLSAVAVPSRPGPAREAPIAERTAVVDADAVADIKPRPSETVVAHAVLMPIGIAPSADMQSPRAGEHVPGSTEADIALAADPENRRDPERPDTMPGTTGVNEPGAITWKVDTALAATAETALPPPMVPPPPAAHPQAALAKAVAPPPRVPASRAARDEDDDDRPRASVPRQRALASRPKTAPHAYGAQGNASRRADPRQHPPGQPVFGPHFPYATPQSGQPHFGPHFPYATPQASRRAAARTPRLPAYGWR